MTNIVTNIASTSKSKRRILSIAVAVILAIMFVLIGDGGSIAYATSSSSNTSSDLGFSSMFSALETMVTVLVLPLGIVLSVWRVVYLATFCGMMGIDPLGMIDETNNFPASKVAQEIRDCFWGVAKGLAWTAGVWVIFKVALSVANMLAATLDANF